MRHLSSNERKKFFISAAVILFLAIQFGLKPYLHKRTATNVVKTVLLHWSNKDLLKAIDQWENEEEYPPVYGVISYKINGSEFFSQDGLRHGRFYVTIDFSENNILPSDKEWVFELRKSKLGWRVFDFYLSEDESFEWENMDLPVI